ncbi:MAG: ABC transporter substrate-binding protein [Xanthobacteraceae bacterium]|nr:ABC transporter substrate-binding protein [Xanthobacteraceae bacterium]QYK45289.1 MAG: ABC transporter substrate-binding protein [Xanthobacteraceae bacterium]
MKRRAPGLSRRNVLALGAAAGASFALPLRAQTPASAERHGISAFGDLKYPANFPHFDYVNPAAPKGGAFSHVGATRQFNQSFNTFNTLNSYIQKGDAALGMELTFATLMTRALDEPDAMYGLAARAVSVSDDGLTYRFHLRPEAKFHDGTRITARDVVFSLRTLKEKGHAILRQLLRDFEQVEAEGDGTVTVRFVKTRGREIPLIVAGLPIFSEAYYKGRNFEDSNLEIPLGSGPYRVGRFEPGRFIEYNRVGNWWAENLNVARGLHNFDVIRYEFYRDRDVAFQGFTARNYLFREEFTSRIWANQYDFPALRDGRVKREVLPDQTPSGAQGWFLNTRRPQLQDPRVREAVGLAFDFEWTNRNVMFSSFERTYSFFQNSDAEAKGKPSPEELALLEPFRGKVPDGVFGEAYLPPPSDGSGRDRNLLRRAVNLLREAGYDMRDNRRVNDKGQGIAIEFLIDDPSFQPHHAALIDNLGRIGIQASLRQVDPVQFRARIDSFDFDATVQRFNLGVTPGESLRTYFSSEAAGINGTQNLAGIKDPAVDALIEKIVEAKSRADLTFACRALDRVLRAGHYWVPQWFKGNHWIAYWDVFARPKDKPRYGRGIPETWWRARAD